MPVINSFESSEYYYSVLFHEMTHWTGHTSRLNRDAVKDPSYNDREEYSKEELIAEFGSCFLNTVTGISNQVIDNTASYIQSWLTALKNDKTMLVHAASKAQRAVEYILKNNKEIVLD